MQILIVDFLHIKWYNIYIKEMLYDVNGRIPIDN